MMDSYGVDRWPLVVVDGRFITSPSHAGAGAPEGTTRSAAAADGPAGDGLPGRESESGQEMTAARSRRLRVFITGASSGIGAALAREYAARGAVLGLLARRATCSTRWPLPCPHPGTPPHLRVDVTDHAALAAAADFIAREGGADIVIASAGVSHGTLTERPEDLSLFRGDLRHQRDATVATFAPFIETMKGDAGPRRLVGIGSVAGIRGMKGAGAYCASKAAVHSYANRCASNCNPTASGS
jgi:NAD(P)-dependent dehydrogenase (short-subunit alcohol dehydrogenase family)